jgi:hypothetical protein
MAMMARDSWTDERLDDLKHTVDEGFKDMRAEFRSVRGEIAAMNQTLTQISYAMFGTMLVGFLGTIAAIVTQS